MFLKRGDLNPITIVNPIDIDNDSTKKSLRKTIKAVEDSQEQKEVPTLTKKESEKK